MGDGGLALLITQEVQCDELSARRSIYILYIYIHIIYNLQETKKPGLKGHVARVTVVHLHEALVDVSDDLLRSPLPR